MWVALAARMGAPLAVVVVTHVKVYAYVENAHHKKQKEKSNSLRFAIFSQDPLNKFVRIVAPLFPLKGPKFPLGSARAQTLGSVWASMDL